MKSGIEPTGTWPTFSEEEQSAAMRVLKSGRVNYWTGSEGRAFEEEYAAYLGVSHAIAVMNGTVALELCLRTLDIGPGDEVIVTPRSFIASASVIVQVGATPVFADIDPVSQNLDPLAAESAITLRTRAIILVHLAGRPCDMDGFLKLSAKHDIRLIEDCAQAHGAKYKGRPIGTFGTMSAFSFCQDKIISTAGEGGMVVTNDESLWKAAWSYKDHGKNPDKIFATTAHSGGFRWLHDSIGGNWRMTEMQAAIGRIQLAGLDANIERRNQIAAMYQSRLTGTKGLNTSSHPLDEQSLHAYYVYYLQIDVGQLSEGWSRDRILAVANAATPSFRAGACPEIYREDAFSDIKASICKHAKALGERSLMLPCHHHLTDAQVENVIQVLLRAMSSATGT